MKKTLTIIMTLFICFVFLQSLPFKFSNSLETQHIFSTLGDWSGFGWFGDIGGYMIGAVELVSSMMLLVPLVSKLMGKPIAQSIFPLGALIALGTMTGAIFFHLFTPLGIVMPYFDSTTGAPNGDDGGLLFIMACITWLCALGLIVMDWLDENSQFKLILGKS